MKIQHKLAALTALSAALISSAALAGGDHAGGHGHDDEAIGKPGVAAKATRTVQIDMTDTMRFSPASVSVKQGETVRFVVKNSGQVKHEMVLGTEKELREHYEVMKKNPEMEHADENMVTVAPGKAGEIVWQFTKAGKIDFACLQPGHYDAGMKGAVTVAAAMGAATKAGGHGDHKH
ncbi:MAG: cupredoxin family protein [Burkholderiaceae bacterium]|nr:cupredoxin family protein [Burkholderiaceae bacterium]